VHELALGQVGELSPVLVTCQVVAEADAGRANPSSRQPTTGQAREPMPATVADGTDASQAPGAGQALASASSLRLTCSYSRERSSSGTTSESRSWPCVR
jgi:hypothetical protein